MEIDFQASYDFEPFMQKRRFDKGDNPIQILENTSQHQVQRFKLEEKGAYLFRKKIIDDVNDYTLFL